MHICTITVKDAASFQALRLLALRESPSSFASSYEEERDRTLAQISAFVAGSNERVIFGAFDGNSLVGICGLGREGSLKERHRGFIRSMYVAPEHRGKGIGGKLLAKACEQAATWVGLEQLTLAVTAGNESAETLYAKHGFVPCGRVPRALRVGGVYFDEVQMVRHTSAASHITHAK